MSESKWREEAVKVIHASNSPTKARWQSLDKFLLQEHIEALCARVEAETIERCAMEFRKCEGALLPWDAEAKLRAMKEKP